MLAGGQQLLPALRACFWIRHLSPSSVSKTILDTINRAFFAECQGGGDRNASYRGQGEPEDLRAASVAWARPSWTQAEGSVKHKQGGNDRALGIAAKRQLEQDRRLEHPRHRRPELAPRPGCIVVSGMAFGPNFFTRMLASLVVRPLGGPALASRTGSGGRPMSEDRWVTVVILSSIVQP